jgi:hypothetical protein
MEQQEAAATAASTMDTEYRACRVAAREGLPLIKMLGEMGI